MAEEQPVKTPPVGITLGEPCAGLSSAEVLAASEDLLTYRQLNYWTASGLLGDVHMHPDGPGGRSRRVDPDEVIGSGYRMCYTAQQTELALWMARLIAVTSSEGDEPLGPRLAARLWRRLVRGEVAGHRFVLVAWEEAPDAPRPT